MRKGSKDMYLAKMDLDGSEEYQGPSTSRAAWEHQSHEIEELDSDWNIQLLLIFVLNIILFKLWFEFSMGKHRDADHRKDSPHFIMSKYKTSFGEVAIKYHWPHE